MTTLPSAVAGCCAALKVAATLAAKTFAKKLKLQPSTQELAMTARRDHITRQRSCGAATFTRWPHIGVVPTVLAALVILAVGAAPAAAQDIVKVDFESGPPLETPITEGKIRLGPMRLPFAG